MLYVALFFLLNTLKGRHQPPTMPTDFTSFDVIKPPDCMSRPHIRTTATGTMDPLSCHNRLRFSC